MPINRGIDKEDVVHIYNRILLTHKKNEMMLFAATWMDLEIIILSEVSQRIQISYDSTCGIKKMLHWLSSHHMSKLAEMIEHKAEKNRPKIDRYGFFGLMLFVGIPLPGTGAWTGSLVAALFDMDLKKASVSILLGIALAAVIMSLFSYGLLGSLIG